MCELWVCGMELGWMWVGLQGGVSPPTPRLSASCPQWSHMFLLIEDQGAQGYELFFKTREMKKKWMEQFEMAM